MVSNANHPLRLYNLASLGISCFRDGNTTTPPHIVGLHATSLEGLLGMAKTGKILPRTEKTEYSGELYDDKIS